MEIENISSYLVGLSCQHSDSSFPLKISWIALHLYLPISFRVGVLLFLCNLSKWFVYPHLVQSFPNVQALLGLCIVPDYMFFLFGFVFVSLLGCLCHHHSGLPFYYIKLPVFFSGISTAFCTLHFYSLGHSQHLFTCYFICLLYHW